MSRVVTDSRAFRRIRNFAYLEDEDRYLTGNDNAKFNFGFIGCGMMGLEHMRNAALIGQARIAGIYDPAQRSIQNALQYLTQLDDREVPTVYATLEQACADPVTDALIIATPNHTHLEVMRVATRYNKAILLEKPIATTVEDAFEVWQLAAQHRNLVRVGLQYRYKAVYAEAIEEVLQRQSVGQVHSVNMLEHRFPFLDKVGQWNKFDECTGGSLIEKCCHYFDLMNLFAGARPERVMAVGGQAVNFKNFTYANKQADGLDQAHVIVDYDNGVIGGFSLCMYIPGTKEELVVCGDAGRLQATESAPLGDANENRIELWAGENGASRITSPAYPAYITTAGHHGSTFFSHLAFLKGLETGQHTGPSMAEAFWSIVTGAAAQASIERGEAVDVAELIPADYPSLVDEPAAGKVTG